MSLENGADVQSTLRSQSHNTMLADVINLSLHGIFGVVGVILNLLVIAVIIKGNKFGKGMKLQLMNLAIADFLSSVMAPGSGFVGGIVTLIAYPDDLALCEIQQYITSVVFYASLACSAAISLERLVAVYFPLNMLKYRIGHVITVGILVWALALIANIDSLIANQVIEKPEHNYTLTCMSGKYMLMGDKYGPWVYIAVARFLVPIIVILASYGFICVKLAKRKRVGEKHRFSNERKNTQVMSFEIVE